MHTTPSITIRGARQHNLKNIDLDLPRNRMVVLTGLSGSGKSSLAFDTLYAEGQRRYVESLSTYARQFLERLDKPDVDLIEGLSPAIAIEQKAASHNPRSTVGTVTEIYDYLRLLYARVGTQHCHQCQRPISRQSLDQIIDGVMQQPEGARVVILAPLVSNQKGGHEKLLQRLRQQGFTRLEVDGAFVEIETLPKLDKKRKHTLAVVVDRLVIKPTIQSRLADSLELALKQSEGLVEVAVMGGERLLFSEKAACTHCNISYPALTPAAFSFNSPHGACPDCSGLGSTTAFDAELIIPDPNISLRDGAVTLWANRSSMFFTEMLEALTSHYGIDIYTPYRDLPESFKQTLLYGSGDEKINFYFDRNQKRFTYQKTFEGLIPRLQRRYLETDSSAARDEIRQYMTFRPCPACQGTKLNPGSSAVRVGELPIAELTARTIDQADNFFQQLHLSGQKALIAQRIVKEIKDRLGFLKDVGLAYLTLDRAAYTLSGGESQRIRLATQIGSKLTGVLYVLDEPSIGLHQRDNLRLLQTLRQLRDLGNTVLVVEHDDDTILTCDHVVDIGPGAGTQGGEVIFSGPPAELLAHPTSLTGRYLSGRLRIPVPAVRRSGNGAHLILEGARANNLQNITVSFPLGCFIGITGVSGSGKSTLIIETLYHALARRLHRAGAKAGAYDALQGLEAVDKVINIDQAPIGRTPRSNPGTYTGVFSHIRELFARTPDARLRGYKPGRFSFNLKGGRCEACSGDGIIKIEMHFLPDIYVPCEVCNGRRYNRETLEITYKGKNITRVLDLTVDQARPFFENIPAIHNKLQTLADVGLGYIRLGQSATTLSGGEAQRLKLSRELAKRGTGRTLYILDEPTTGLHIDDIQKLLHVLNRLVDNGNTVVVIEHNMEIIKSCDYLIDLGPEGGLAGGTVVACGAPEAVVQVEASHTGRFLRGYLEPVGG